MKALQNLILTLLFVSLSFMPECKAQTNNNTENYPGTSYNVHRKYDNDGNLIYYDSVSVSSWNYDSSIVAIDTVFDVWEYGKPIHTRPHYYGFHFPGGPYDYIPEFEFNFVVPDFHDFDEGFEYDFSLSPTDSLHSSIFPDDTLLYHQHVMPPEDWQLFLNEQIYRMQRYIEELNRSMYEHYNSPDYNESEPYDEENPNKESAPEPSENNYEEDLIDI